MRLQVRDLVAGIGGERLERADLVSDHVLQVVCTNLDAPPPEAPEIVVARMAADADALFLGLLHDIVHRHRVACMEPAGDAG